MTPTTLSSLLLLCASSPIHAFLHPHPASFLIKNAPLYAESGPPQYEKIDATLLQTTTLGKGSVELRVGVSQPVQYSPGHVIALEIKDEENIMSDNKDVAANGGWARGPYTISRSRDSTSEEYPNEVDVVIKVVGKKSEMMSQAKVGTPMKLGGKFKVPILEGIDTESVKRVVLVSTGVGIGPCVGAIEDALKKKESFPLIELVASYREEDEVAYRELLDGLVKDYGEKRLKWTPVVTSAMGRLSSSEENLERLLFASAQNEGLGVDDTHYHLIGNGQMVNEFKEGLLKAGVPDNCVTLEMYFNHKADVSNEVIDRIASVAAKCAMVESVA